MAVTFVAAEDQIVGSKLSQSQRYKLPVWIGRKLPTVSETIQKWKDTSRTEEAQFNKICIRGRQTHIINTSHTHHTLNSFNNDNHECL